MPRGPGSRTRPASWCATASGSRWERFGPATPLPGQRTILLTPTWSILHSRFWKAQVPVPRALLPGPHLGRPRERPLRPPDRRRRVHRRHVRRGRPRGARCERHRRPRSSSGCRTAPAGRSCSPRSIPSASTARCSIGCVAPVPDRRPAARTSARTSTRSATRTRAGTATTRPRGGRTTTASSSSSSRVLHRAPLDQADRGLHRVGARDRPRDADPDGDDDRGSTTGRRSRRSPRGCAARRS